MTVTASSCDSTVNQEEVMAAVWKLSCWYSLKFTIIDWTGAAIPNSWKVNHINSQYVSHRSGQNAPLPVQSLYHHCCVLIQEIKPSKSSHQNRLCRLIWFDKARHFKHSKYSQEKQPFLPTFGRFHCAPVSYVKAQVKRVSQSLATHKVRWLCCTCDQLWEVINYRVIHAVYFPLTWYDVCRVSILCWC